MSTMSSLSASITTSSSSIPSRPSAVRRAQCYAASTGATNAFPTTIFGDTYAATKYAQRLVSNGITNQIHVLVEGPNFVNTQCVNEVAFPAINSRKILAYLGTEQIHIVSSGSLTDPCSDVPLVRDEIIQYNVGFGVNGDYVGTYTTVVVGPWFQSQTTASNYIVNYVNANTTKQNLTVVESSVISFLSRHYNIPIVNSVVVPGPSILSVHYAFALQASNGAFVRNVGAQTQMAVAQVPNVAYALGAANIRFIPTVSSDGSQVTGLYSVVTQTNTKQAVEIPPSRVVWKTNPYTYLRVATTGGLSPTPVAIPTFYRVKYPIPASLLNSVGVATGSTSNNTNSSSSHLSTSCNCSSSFNSSVGSSNPTATAIGADLVTSSIEFSLYDLAHPSSTSIAWFCRAYTTPEDLSVTDQAGSYAAPGYQFLILEAYCTNNRRVAEYDMSLQETVVNLNPMVQEVMYRGQAASIFSTVALGYGFTISPEVILSEPNMCTPHAVCQDSQIIVDYSLRESPLTIALQSIGQLYGNDIFLNAGQSCC
jgi:hypothetical protein